MPWAESLWNTAHYSMSSSAGRHMTFAMLCYAMLCYAMLCYAMLCYAMLCHAMLSDHRTCRLASVLLDGLCQLAGGRLRIRHLRVAVCSSCCCLRTGGRSRGPCCRSLGLLLCRILCIVLGCETTLRLGHVKHGSMLVGPHYARIAAHALQSNRMNAIYMHLAAKKSSCLSYVRCRLLHYSRSSHLLCTSSILSCTSAASRLTQQAGPHDDHTRWAR